MSTKVPVGPENDRWIKHEAEGADLVIAAWGANSAGWRDRGRWTMKGEIIDVPLIPGDLSFHNYFTPKEDLSSRFGPLYLSFVVGSRRILPAVLCDVPPDIRNALRAPVVADVKEPRWRNP